MEYRLKQLSRISEPDTIVIIRDGSTSMDHIDARNAITTFHRISSSAANATSRLAIGADETDCKALVTGAIGISPAKCTEDCMITGNSIVPGLVRSFDRFHDIVNFCTRVSQNQYTHTYTNRLILGLNLSRYFSCTFAQLKIGGTSAFGSTSGCQNSSRFSEFPFCLFFFFPFFVFFFSQNHAFECLVPVDTMKKKVSRFGEIDEKPK